MKIVKFVKYFNYIYIYFIKIYKIIIKKTLNKFNKLMEPTYINILDELTESEKANVFEFATIMNIEEVSIAYTYMKATNFDINV